MELENNPDLQQELEDAKEPSTTAEETPSETKEEEKSISKPETNTTYASTTKTVGFNNFSFVTVSPK